MCRCLYLFCLLDNYDPEGYNPESPGLTAPGPNSYRQFIPRVQSQRSNLIGLTSSEGQVSRGNHCSHFSLKLFRESGFSVGLLSRFMKEFTIIRLCVVWNV